MCLSTINWRSAWFALFPIKQMDGYKCFNLRYMGTDKPMDIISPMYDREKPWVIGERRESSGHGFYFCPTRKEAEKYCPYNEILPVRAYGVFRRGKQAGAIVYMAHGMELLPDPKQSPYTDAEKRAAVETAIKDLSGL